jgi:hypothetical protein
MMGEESPRARPRMCNPLPNSAIRSCCFRQCRIRTYRRTRPLLRTGESHRESSIRLPPAASDWRCPLAIDVCAQVTPPLRTMRPLHDAACHVAVADSISMEAQ